jgi:hypothetical protein
MDTTIKNITTRPQRVRRLFTKDDWDIPNKRAEILEYEYTVEGEEPIKFTGDAEVREDKTVQVHMKDVSLPAGKTIRTYSRGVEFRRYSDRFFEEWIYPVVKPELNIRGLPEELTYRAEFSHDPPVSVIQNGRRHILQGTLMPHQKVGLRWFPKNG